MRTWASISTIGLTLSKAIVVVLAASAATGCGGTKMGKIMADTPVLPYQAPDIDELTGIETPDPDDATETPAEAPPESAQNPQK